MVLRVFAHELPDLKVEENSRRAAGRARSLLSSGVDVAGADHHLVVSWSDGLSARFHAEWLRDVSTDAATRDPQSGQRLITIDQVARDVAIDQVMIADDDDETLVIDFSDGTRGHRFRSDWLREHRYDVARPPVTSTTVGSGGVREEARPWRAADMRDRVVSIDLPSLEEGGLDAAAWLDAMVVDGVTMVTGVPLERGALHRIVRSFGYVRETNYGPWFDVRSLVNAENLANTNLGLQAHTDNPYRDPVPTMQVLACLENDVDGGASTVVDGYAVAEELRRTNPAGFALLATRAARFEWLGDGEHVLRSKRPMIELGTDGEVTAIRFNSRSIAPIRDVPFDEMRDYYDAYREFSALVDDPRFAVSFRLEPGEAFVVDNTRVLHARSAFGGVGSRWLQGCYADMDAVWSKRAVLQRRHPIAIIERLFARHGDTAYLGESISMSAHMLQAAAIAEARGASDTVIAAALLHDIGHFTGELGAYDSRDVTDRRHDDAGRRFLARHVVPAVAEVVGLHVAAKRWLCATEPDYLATLSPASTHTLSLQGGPMGATERRQFELSPFWRDAVSVRRFDDAAKVPGARTKSLTEYRRLLQGCLVAPSAGRESATCGSGDRHLKP